MVDRETVPCKICGDPTPMLETHLCDPCWELQFRMALDPERTAKVLDHVTDLAFKIFTHIHQLATAKP